MAGVFFARYVGMLDPVFDRDPNLDVDETGAARFVCRALGRKLFNVSEFAWRRGTHDSLSRQ